MRVEDSGRLIALDPWGERGFQKISVSVEWIIIGLYE